MRVLFVSYSERTHFFSMVPVAWALRTAGHEVRVASSPALADTITQTGLTAVPLGHDHLMWDFLRRHPQFETRIREGLFPPYHLGDAPEEEITWRDLKRGYDELVPWAFRLVNDPLLNDLVGFCRQWRPDLVVWEPTTYAGAIAAEACGAAHARLIWGLDFDGRLREQFVRLRDMPETTGRGDPLREWLARRGAPFGVEVTDSVIQGDFTIDQLPASFRLPSTLDYVEMQYVPYNGPSVVPEWLRRPAGRPRVALTLGTGSTEILERYSVSLRSLLDALADVDADVVALLPEEEQRTLGTLPDNIRALSFVPLNDLLPTCSAIVHHGGFGTTCTASLAGVPQLLVAEMHDAPAKARRLVDRGAALFVPFGEVSVDKVRAGVCRLLSETSFGDGARSVRAEMLAMRSPNEAVTGMERRTTHHRARRAEAAGAAATAAPTAV